MDKPQNSSEAIIALLNKKEWLSSGEIDKLAGIDRFSYTSRLLAKLLQEGKIINRRDGRNVLYKINPENVFFEDDLDLVAIDEAGIFSIIETQEKYKELVGDRIGTIFGFAFTEMLNNAKDHSKSGVAYVKAWEKEGVLGFLIRDKGIGVFRNIKTFRKLKDENEAIQELVKGKITTRPEMHSGEGIFWTSKMSDRFTLGSYGYMLLIDNTVGDYTIQKNESGSPDYVLGTEVEFEISLGSQTSMAEVFKRFSLDKKTYSFNTTEIPLKLYDYGDFWVSRSQAKRVLSGLEGYKKIIFDFSGIDLIGQGFADEIFRVFNIAHPEIILQPKNMNENVKMLVNRAINDKTGRE